MIHLYRMRNRLSLWLGGISVPLWGAFLRQSSPQRNEAPQRHRRSQRQILSALVLALFLGLLSVGSITSAAKEAQPNEDPQIAQRMKNLTEQLRCLVCQNETL